MRFEGNDEDQVASARLDPVHEVFDGLDALHHVGVFPDAVADAEHQHEVALVNVRLESEPGAFFFFQIDEDLFGELAVDDYAVLAP